MARSANARQIRSERGTNAVAQALQHYADRGVFRGFSVREGPGRQKEFQFTWLATTPITLAYDPQGGALIFRNLLPGAGRDATLARELKVAVKDHVGRAVPAHRRIDQRRARVTCWVRRGDFSVGLQVRDQHYAYAVQRGLNLVNALFLLLHSTYPDYLSKHFGLPEE